MMSELEVIYNAEKLIEQAEKLINEKDNEVLKALEITEQTKKWAKNFKETMEILLDNYKRYDVEK